MTASYDVLPAYTNQSAYGVSGVAKVRFRDEYLWFWDSEGNVLLLVHSSHVRFATRADIDAGSADEDVVELLDLGASPVEAATVRGLVPGVTSVTTKFAETNAYAKCLVLESDDDDLPAALVNAQYYIMRRQGAVITTAP